MQVNTEKVLMLALWFDHAVHRLDIESSLKHLSSIISK